jgi:capsular exopolysaccharide synthesis family protein
MSRVFEALTKASQDRERKAESTPREFAPMIQEVNPVDHSSQKYDWRAEGNSQRESVRTSLPKSLGVPKSWRERMEELFFGWDLRRYETHPIVVLEEESAISEQYKILREQLKRLRTEAGIRTIAITSPVKRDGKTTVSVNLAAAIALEYEEKVILVDADLRAPSVHRYFNYDGLHGLTEYLSSNSASSVKSLVRDTHVNGLRYIPAGKPTRFASELLAKEKMRRLIEELHAEYPGHMLIIDSPPVLATPDPMVLSRQVDGVIMVIRARKTPKDYLAKALSAFSTDKILGVVLNGADLGLGSKYYYYYSSNGHG